MADAKSHQLLFATFNQHKLEEVRQLFGESAWQVLSPSSLGIPNFEVSETGETFAENAALKAEAFISKTLSLIVADDSGLEVAALDGAPGVHSKRWVAGSDQDRIIHLLEKLENVEERRARFVTVLCLLDPKTREKHFFEGEVRGKIARQPRGSAGFGYDPIFIPEGYTETFGQLGTEVKNQLSHRARAFQKLQAHLDAWQNGRA